MRYCYCGKKVLLQAKNGSRHWLQEGEIFRVKGNFLEVNGIDYSPSDLLTREILQKAKTHVPKMA